MSADADSEKQAFCSYHPERPAFVRCGECGKPLCAECVHHGPIGTRCVECLWGIQIRPVSRRRRLAGGAAALAVSLAVGCALGYWGLLNWLTGIGLGLVVGHVARTVARSVSTRDVQAAAGIAAALGAYCGAVAAQARQLALVGAPSLSLPGAAANVELGDWALAGLLAAGTAIYWVWRQ